MKEEEGHAAEPRGCSRPDLYSIDEDDDERGEFSWFKCPLIIEMGRESEASLILLHLFSCNYRSVDMGALNKDLQNVHVRELSITTHNAPRHRSLSRRNAGERGTS